ncbi:GntR family transcriptional regulator [Streptomyces sp. NBC_01267]|uniref:GntR family transcriptional regulator n=1 Tax=unclassified Streptomyces TaxID=2593676 RepID=UPI0022568C15|nr:MULTISPECIES: GntR family transcriptional regulator [unclassified Streptomyces]MCX4553369.1 GntR family transcriptional regulator [Streptomyces sp. NBC_01500]WSC18332.1 GntR family transcriptional regulator [Streptomyces sp. NBC_01766]
MVQSTGYSPGPSDGSPARRADRARNVADVLRQQAASGLYPTGFLPDERLLAADFAVSRNTVRQALFILRDEGLVERRRGVGTVLLNRKYAHPLGRLAGLAETLHAHGTVDNQVRARGPVVPPVQVARRLSVPEGEEVVRLERLRRLDGVPLSLDLTYLPTDIGLPLLDLDLENQDVFALIEQSTGQRLGAAEVTVQAVNADPHTAGILAAPAGTALFAVERLSRLSDGRPVDLEFLSIRGDRLTLRADLDRAGRGSG